MERNSVKVGDVGKAIKKKWWWLFCGSIVGGGICLAMSLWILAPQYESSISLCVNNSSTSTLVSNMNVNDVIASQELVNTYKALLADESVFAEISRRLVGEYDPQILSECFDLIEIGETQIVKYSDLRDAIQIEEEADTEILKIVVQTSNSEISADICGMTAEIAADIFQSVVQTGEVNQITSPKVNQEPVSLSAVEMAAAGAAGGAATAFFLLLLSLVLDSRIHGTEEFSLRYDIPVLGIIPNN